MNDSVVNNFVTKKCNKTIVSCDDAAAIFNFSISVNRWDIENIFSGKKVCIANIGSRCNQSADIDTGTRTKMDTRAIDDDNLSVRN